MIYTCLNNWIGINDCTDSTSDSGVYINDLPGVQLEQAYELTNGDDPTLIDVFNKVRNNALRRLSVDLNAEFSKRWQLKTVLNSLDFGKTIDATNTTSSDTQYRGFVYELNYENSQWTGSNLKIINLQTVNLYLSSAQSTTIKVFDLDTNEELFTQDVTGSEGWNLISIQQDFQAYRIFIAYDSTAIDSVQLDVEKLQLNCDCEGMVRGAYSTVADPYTVVKGSSSFGLSAVISERCSYDRLVCNNKSNFTTPYLYLLGSELMTERINSDTINRFTTTDIAQARSLRTRFELEYKGGVTGDDTTSIKVDGALTTSTAGINLSEWDECLECSSPVRSRYAKV